MMIAKYLYFAVIVVFIVNNTASAMEGAATVAVAAPMRGAPEGTGHEDDWILKAVKICFSKPTVVKPERPSVVDSFVVAKKPSIALDCYIDRFFKYLEFSPHLFIIALIYLDRIAQKNKWFFLSDYNVHKMLFTAIYVADKMFEDVFYGLGHAAKIAGLSVEELKGLELYFLKLIQFDLFVSCEEHCCYKRALFDFYKKSISVTVVPSSSAPVQMSSVLAWPHHNTSVLLSDSLAKCTLL